MAKCKIGVVGIGRGSMMWTYCKDADNAQLVAICDQWEEGLRRVEGELADDGITYYTDFAQFIKHDMDIVVLANYATEHAPFAIQAMEAGKNVISEVLPVQTMAQAVALVECIERTGKKYCYAENYCYMNAPREMKKNILQVNLENSNMVKENISTTVNQFGQTLLMENAIIGVMQCLLSFIVHILLDHFYI